MSDSTPDGGVKGKKFGMVSGVFIPTLLTILGVIMFLRLGWVVGSVGLVGSWVIIGIAFLITATTALSMSSIITNMKIEVKPISEEEWIDQAPQADMNIFSLDPKPDFDQIRERVDKAESTCLYCRDSAVESVLA